MNEFLCRVFGHRRTVYLDLSDLPTIRHPWECSRCGATDPGDPPFNPYAWLAEMERLLDERFGEAR